MLSAGCEHPAGRGREGVASGFSAHAKGRASPTRSGMLTLAMSAADQSLTELENLLGPRLFEVKVKMKPPLLLDRRYEIEAIRGRGARGLVVKARDVRLARSVALKIYPHFEPALIAEVEREAQWLARLRHPNIVAVHDVGSAELEFGVIRVPCLFLAMDYIDGPHLRSWIDSERPRPLVIVDAFIAAGEGLAAAHEAGVLHRDVKPANIVLDKQTARVVDFGLAREVPRANEPEGVRSTQYGVTTGTLAYMAPEARRGRVEQRSDLFSFTVSLWESLAGELPFDPEAGEWRLGNHDDFFGADAIPRVLGDVLRRAMSHDLNQRQGSIRELLDELRSRRDRVESGTFTGVVHSILSPFEAGIRRIIGQPRGGVTSRWVDRARAVMIEAEEKAKAEARAAAERAKAGDTKRIPPRGE